MLVACASLRTSEYPIWIDNEIKSNGYLFFVGYGEGSTQKEARDKAFENALIKMGDGLGYDPREYYLRELIAYEKISSLGSTVSDYYEEFDDGLWHSWVKIDTIEATYVEARSEEYKALLDREDRISKLIEESLAEYRANRDVSTINKVLEAIVVSLEGPVENPEYTPESLLAKAVSYVDSLKFSLRKESKGNIGVMVRLSRSKGLFNPRVVDALVLSSYDIVNSSENIVVTSFISKTDEKGEFHFHSTNPYIIREGDITFSIILDESVLNSIAASAGSDFIQPLYDAMASRDVEYSYIESGKIARSETLIILSQMDINGKPLNNDNFVNAFVSFFNTALNGGWSVLKDIGDEDIEEILERISERYPEIKNFVISRIGIVEFAESPMYYFAKTEGYSFVYSREEDGILSLIADHHSYSMGEGATLESAQTEALLNQARISASLLLEEL